MALRGIQEYIARDANNNNVNRRLGQYCPHQRQYILVSPEKEPSNTIIIIIYIGHYVSSYNCDCQLPYFVYKQRAYVERSSSGNIQVTEYSLGNNVSEHVQITRFYFGH